ncbi:MAG: class I SAM-dependent methyltransferase [Candidatus Bilamarchaeaceae archaeon]
MKIDEDKEFLYISKAPLADRDVLEVGCGDGRLSLRIAGIARSLTAVDPDERKISLACTRIPQSLSGRIVFKTGFGESLDFPNESFDTVFYSLSFHHLPIDKQLDGLKEARRVLRKGGHLIVYEPDPAGTMQRLFLLFEDELKELKQVYKTLKEAERLTLFRDTKKLSLSICWHFDNLEDIVSFFSAEYGKDAIQTRMERVSEIIGVHRPPIVLEDKLFLFELSVVK